ncbi:kinase domain protein [Ancylostoma ceylanicum]|uniref:non-specific serine/threonine protein kinase n=1 Tax=Ancylostoma ceylanicum TaxID=53326 RepID=A0A0D6LW39_9BILA|nr:kinase domain protein [Ancylostoma ceylanicum]
MAGDEKKANKPKPPAPTNGSSNQMNGNHETVLEFELGLPHIDSDDYFDVFSWLVMFVAWLYRWLSPSSPSGNDVGSNQSPCSDEDTAHSCASHSRSASIDDFESSVQDCFREFSYRETDEDSAIATSSSASASQQPSPLSLYVGVPSICSKFNSLLFGPSWNDCAADDDLPIIMENVRFAHEHNNALHEKRASTDSWICNDNDGYVEHKISVIFTPCYSNDFETTVLLPEACATPGLTEQFTCIESPLLEASFSVPLQSQNTQEEFSDCRSRSESFVTSSEFPCTIEAAEKCCTPFEDCSSSTSLTMTLRKSDVENTTPNGNTTMKKSKTDDNCYQVPFGVPEGYYGNVGPWSKPVSFQNFKPGEEYNNWSGSPGSESAGHRSGSSEDGEPAVQEEVLGSDDEEQEDPRDYRRGGYHPVNIGDVFNRRYHVIRKLGWGHFSTVWLCWDTKDKRFVAMKIVKSADHYTEAAQDEIKLLLAVREADPEDPGCQRVVQLLDEFTVSGVNGVHTCMVFEVLGCNLLKLIIRSNYQGLPLEQVRKITKQVLEGLRYLHEKSKIIHTDIKPENVLVTMSHEEVKLMAQHAVVATKMNLKLSGSAVSTAPSHVQKKVQENMTKNKKKKLKKKAKKQRELLESQLAQMEGLTVDPTAIQEVLNSAPNSARGYGNPPPPTLMNNSSSGPVPQLLQNCAMGETQQTMFCNPTYHSIQQEGDGVTATIVQDISDAEGEPNAPLQQVLSPAPIDRTSLSPPSDTELRNAIDTNRAFGFADTPLSPSNPFSTQQLPTVLPTPPVGPNLNDPYADIEVKIADLGNACWTHHHFTEDIQTRQYRSLEVLIGAGYGPPADIWSTACMAFELATGDYLFEPHNGDNYSRDEDHLAHICELLGSIPPSVYKKGQHWKEFFNKQGRLLHIHQLKPWPLLDVLRQKYDWPFEQARQFASFLIPMLAFDQDERVTAAQALEHDWLKPFGGKPPPPDVPVEVLKRIYPDGNVPGRENLVNFASANGADVRQMDLDFEQEQCRSDLGSAEV